MNRHTAESRMAPQTERPKIGIIGGHGRMGTWFARFFQQQGHDVLVSDLDTDLTPEKLAAQCEVVILSVPMKIFPEIARKVGPLMDRESFLTDFCSLKETQVACMLEHSVCEVVGTHPLFGPAEQSLEKKRIALCPGRGKRWLSWWDGLLRRHGALTCTLAPAEHDRAMAWIQAINHFLLLSLGKALEEDGIDLKQLLALATPSFEKQMKIVARLSLQDPELYAAIQMANPYAKRALETFNRHSSALKDIISRKDKASFIRIFQEVQKLGELILSD